MLLSLFIIVLKLSQQFMVYDLYDKDIFSYLTNMYKSDGVNNKYFKDFISILFEFLVKNT